MRLCIILPHTFSPTLPLNIFGFLHRHMGSISWIHKSSLLPPHRLFHIIIPTYEEMIMSMMWFSILLLFHFSASCDCLLCCHCCCWSLSAHNKKHLRLLQLWCHILSLQLKAIRLKSLITRDWLARTTRVEGWKVAQNFDSLGLSTCCVSANINIKESWKWIINYFQVQRS